MALLAVGLLLSVSLSIALAVVPPHSQLAPQITATPINYVKTAYLPLLLAEGGTVPTATPTTVPTSTATPTTTPSATPTTTPVPVNTFALSVTEQLQWYNPGSPPANYDIVIVQDYGQSMRNCWDSEVECSTATQSRRIDGTAQVLRWFVDEMLVQRRAQTGAKHRLAYITFGEKSGSTMVTSVRVPFSLYPNYTTNPAALPTAALNQFKLQIGDIANPRVIPNSELTGQSNTAAGLAAANELMAAHRADAKLIVILLTDGAANVFNDGGMAGIANSHTQAPFNCGAGVDGLENPLVQWTCPGPEEFPGQTLPQPPIKATVAAAEALRADYPDLTIFAGQLSEASGLTPADLRLNEVAPTWYFRASSPVQLQGQMVAIAEEFGNACQRMVGTRRPAAGAQVTIRNTDGISVASGLVSASGTFSTTLAPGQYTVEAQHLNVVAPADMQAIPRNYTRLQPSWASQNPDGIPLTMPSQALGSYSANLAIDNPANATCP